jgi:hypothetical protein
MPVTGSAEPTSGDFHNRRNRADATVLACVDHRMFHTL